MYWESPYLLLLLWAVPCVIGLLFYAHRKRQSTAIRFADKAMVARLLPALQPARLWIKGIALALGLTCLVMASARPRFGVYFEQVTQRGVDVFVLLDVSRSMLAEDVAPSRLERAKSDILDLLKKLTGDRVGLIAFAGAPVVKVPLTTDQAFYRMVLDEIGPHSAPRGGSLIGDAIRKAMESMPTRADRDQVLVLITDGEDHDSFPAEAAQQAGEQGIKIITIGLGDVGEGARIPVRDEVGELRYMKFEGQEVWSTMDEELLKEIALKTSGAYIPARTRLYDLGQIYEDHLADLTRGELHAEKRKRHRDRFQLFACVGLLFLFVDLLVPSYRVSSASSASASSPSAGSRASHSQSAVIQPTTVPKTAREAQEDA